MMTNRLSRLFQAIALLIAAALAMIATPALADYTPTCRTNPQNIPVTMSSVLLARDAQPGDLTLLTGWVTTPVDNTWFVCTNSPTGGDASTLHGFGVGFQPGALTSAGKTYTEGSVTYTVWQTNIQGVGIVIGVNPSIVSTRRICNLSSTGWTDVGQKGTSFPAGWHGRTCSDTGADQTAGGQIRVALVKYGPIAAGTVTAIEVARAAAMTTPLIPGGAWTQNSDGLITFSITPTDIMVPTCSTPDVPVTLLPASPADFGGVADKVVGVQTFNIKLTCPAGNPVKVYMTITDNANQSNMTNNLTLSTPPDGATSASGVAIRIVNKSTNTDVVYGPDSPVPGNKNQFYIFTLGSGTADSTISVPFTASYVSTSATVTAGEVYATATYTMSYQ